MCRSVVPHAGGHEAVAVAKATKGDCIMPVRVVMSNVGGSSNKKVEWHCMDPPAASPSVQPSTNRPPAQPRPPSLHDKTPQLLQPQLHPPQLYQPKVHQPQHKQAQKRPRLTALLPAGWQLPNALLSLTKPTRCRMHWGACGVMMRTSRAHVHSEL
jgi:hypothetical protein